MPDGNGELRIVQVTKVPVDALDALRAAAIRDGRPDSDASVMRYAAVELARRLRSEPGIDAG